MGGELAKSLEQLEGAWSEPDFDSGLVSRCHGLRRVPLQQLTPGDMRVLIGQHVGLSHLVPLALDVLEREPLVDTELYPGDLLSAVLQLGREYWLENPQHRAIVHRLLASLPETPAELVPQVAEFRRVTSDL